MAIVLPTSPAFMDAFFGTLLAGAVPVPLYPPVRLGRLEEYHRSTARMIQASGARMVLERSPGAAAARSGDRARPARARLPSTSPRSPRTRSATTPARSARGSRADALGLIQFSSGSTVDPKPVALTQRQLLAQLAMLEQLMPYEPGATGVSWLPLYHDMGLIGALLSSVYYPGPLTLIPPEHFLVKPALWLRAISRHRSMISAGPNFAYALCCKRVKDEELEGVDLSTWKYAPNGAEPVSVAVLARFSERFAKFGFDAKALLPVYGLSEAALAVTFSPSGRTPRSSAVDPQHLAVAREVRSGTREIASVGIPVPGTEVRDPSATRASCRRERSGGSSRAAPR